MKALWWWYVAGLSAFFLLFCVLLCCLMLSCNSDQPAVKQIATSEPEGPLTVHVAYFPYYAQLPAANIFKGDEYAGLVPPGDTLCIECERGDSLKGFFIGPTKTHETPLGACGDRPARFDIGPPRYGTMDTVYWYGEYRIF